MGEDFEVSWDPSWRCIRLSQSKSEKISPSEVSEVGPKDTNITSNHNVMLRAAHEVII